MMIVRREYEEVRWLLDFYRNHRFSVRRSKGGKKQLSSLMAVENGGFSAYTTAADVVVSKASAWAVGSIWVSKASVLEQHEKSLAEQA